MRFTVLLQAWWRKTAAWWTERFAEGFLRYLKVVGFMWRLQEDLSALLSEGCYSRSSVRKSVNICMILSLSVGVAVPVLHEQPARPHWTLPHDAPCMKYPPDVMFTDSFEPTFVTFVIFPRHLATRCWTIKILLKVQQKTGGGWIPAASQQTFRWCMKFHYEESRIWGSFLGGDSYNFWEQRCQLNVFSFIQ